MAHTFTNLLYHLVFSTKSRVPQIDVELQPSLFPYMGGIVRELGGVPLIVNGTEDHVHLLVVLPQTVAVADALRILKANSSKWVHERWPRRRRFQWQTGYGAFTVSESRRNAVQRYIAGQAEHHRKPTFQEEFVALLKKHRVQYDPQSLWD